MSFSVPHRAGSESVIKMWSSVLQEKKKKTNKHKHILMEELAFFAGSSLTAQPQHSYLLFPFDSSLLSSWSAIASVFSGVS